MEHVTELEVRYYETDGQGVVHHANYLKYFEIARIEMLRQMGHEYADFERDGVLLVVHSVACKYHRPARFGDRLQIRTTIERATPARIEHRYRVTAADRLLVEASTTIACVDRQGNVRRMPACLVAD